MAGGTQIKDGVPAAWREGAGRELLHYRLTVVGAAEGWTVGAVVGMTVGHVVDLDDGASVGTCVWEGDPDSSLAHMSVVVWCHILDGWLRPSGEEGREAKVVAIDLPSSGLHSGSMWGSDDMHGEAAC